MCVCIKYQNIKKYILTKYQAKQIKIVKEYLDRNFIASFVDRKKIFYNLNELWGWRFYVKAIRHRDWRSLFNHITRRIWPTK